MRAKKKVQNGRRARNNARTSNSDANVLVAGVAAAIEHVVPTIAMVVEAVIKDREAERLHEVKLLEKDREYAIRRLEVNAAYRTNIPGTAAMIASFMAGVGPYAPLAHDAQAEPTDKPVDAPGGPDARSA